ncbi:MAG: exo-alpha-sialidase [Chthoniobacteraceae bacterium]
MFFRLIIPLCVVSVSSVSARPREITPPSFRGAAQPRVAVAPSGRIHIVFGKDKAIYHVTSSDGEVFSTPVKIATLDQLALGKRRGPRVTATDTTVLVTAISHGDGNLHAWISDSEGQIWKEIDPINTVLNSAREGLQALAGDGRGGVMAVWLDLRDGGTELWGRHSVDGGRTWSADFSLYGSPDGHICECCVPNIAFGPRGRMAAMWRNWLDGSRDLYLATSDTAGGAFKAASKLGTGTWKLEGCPMDGGSIAFAPSGEWLAAWRRGGTVFTSSPDHPEKLLARSAAQPVVGFAGLVPLVFWESGGSLILQRGSKPPVPFAESASAAAIASGPDAAVVVWESSVGGNQTILLDRVLY